MLAAAYSPREFQQGWAAALTQGTVPSGFSVAGKAGTLGLGRAGAGVR